MKPKIPRDRTRTNGLAMSVTLTCILLLRVAVPGAPAATPALEPWEYVSSLQTARVSHGMTANSNTLYAIGGTDAAGATLSSVEYATVAADGSLSPWQFTTPLKVPRTLSTAVATETHVYVIGGAQDASLIGKELASVEYAPIMPGGSLGPWSFTSSLTSVRANAVGLLRGNFIYVVGGYGGGQLDTVERAEILPDGGLGPWVTLPSRLMLPRERPGAAIAGDFLVVLGGLSREGGGIQNTTEFAAILADGTLGPWQAGPPMSVPRYHLTAAAVGTMVFALGGYNDGHLPGWATSEQSAVGPSGPLPWVEGPTMQEVRNGLASCTVGASVYVSGGAAENFSSTVERAVVSPNPFDIDSDGVLDDSEAMECLGTEVPAIVNPLGCSLEQICPCVRPWGRLAWKGHGEYVHCIVNAAKEFQKLGVMSKHERRAAVKQARKASCGSAKARP